MEEARTSADSLRNSRGGLCALGPETRSSEVPRICANDKLASPSKTLLGAPRACLDIWMISDRMRSPLHKVARASAVLPPACTAMAWALCQPIGADPFICNPCGRPAGPEPRAERSGSGGRPSHAVMLGLSARRQGAPPSSWPTRAPQVAPAVEVKTTTWGNAVMKGYYNRSLLTLSTSIRTSWLPLSRASSLLHGNTLRITDVIRIAMRVLCARESRSGQECCSTTGDQRIRRLWRACWARCRAIGLRGKCGRCQRFAESLETLQACPAMIASRKLWRCITGSLVGRQICARRFLQSSNALGTPRTTISVKCASESVRTARCAMASVGLG